MPTKWEELYDLIVVVFAQLIAGTGEQPDNPHLIATELLLHNARINDAADKGVPGVVYGYLLDLAAKLVGGCYHCSQRDGSSPSTSARLAAKAYLEANGCRRRDITEALDRDAIKSLGEGAEDNCNEQPSG